MDLIDNIGSVGKMKHAPVDAFQDNWGIQVIVDMTSSIPMLVHIAMAWLTTVSPDK